jgi:heptaprenyl diphosphate synthase
MENIPSLKENNFLADMKILIDDHEKRLASMALLVAMGIILHRVEALLPLPSPWIKLGLANIMTLLALVFLGFREALVVTVLRIFLGAIVGGTFLSPTFFLSLAGGLAAAFAMSLAYCKGKGPFSLIGVSVISATAHTLAITLFVFVFFIRQDAFLHLLPVFFSFSLISGILTGIIANSLSHQIRHENVAFK